MVAFLQKPCFWWDLRVMESKNGTGDLSGVWDGLSYGESAPMANRGTSFQADVRNWMALFGWGVRGVEALALGS